MFRSRKSKKEKIHYVHVPRRNQNYLPMMVFTMLITLIICVSLDNVPAGSKEKITGSRVVKIIDNGIHKFQKRIYIAKKRVNKYIKKKSSHHKKRS